MVVVTIKTRNVDCRQKRVLFDQIADSDEQTRLNLDKKIVQLVGVRQADVVVVSAANREMDRIFKRRVVRTELTGDETATGRSQIGRQRRCGG